MKTVNVIHIQVLEPGSKEKYTDGLDHLVEYGSLLYVQPPVAQLLS